MENKSKLKYYLLGLVVLIVIIVVIMLLGNSKSGKQQSQAENTVSTTTTNTSATPNINSTSSDELVGAWASSVQGKGMQGSGKVVFQGTSYQINFTGDVNLNIQKVENNVGTGTIAFSNLCLTTTGVNKKAQCLKSYTESAVMQIVGNTINFTGQTVLGANLSLTGIYTNDSISGTFVRTSTSGKINGTFDLIRAKS